MAELAAAAGPPGGETAEDSRAGARHPASSEHGAVPCGYGSSGACAARAAECAKCPACERCPDPACPSSGAGPDDGDSETERAALAPGELLGLVGLQIALCVAVAFAVAFAAVWLVGLAGRA